MLNTNEEYWQEYSYRTPKGHIVEVVAVEDGVALVRYLEYASGALAEWPEYDDIPCSDLTKETD